MLSYCFFIIIPVMLIGYFADSIYVKSIREQTESNVNGTLSQMGDNISFKMKDIIRVSDLLYYDHALARNLKSYEEGWVSYSATTRYLLPKFQSSIEATSLQMWISIYLHNETFPEIYRSYNGEDPLRISERWYDLYHISRIIDKRWYKQFPEEDYGITMQWKQVDDDPEYGYISLLRRMVNVQSVPYPQEIGFLKLSVYLSDLFESVDHNKIGNGATIFITDASNEIMMSSGESEYEQDVLWDEELYKDYLIMEEFIPELEWKITAVIPNQIFTDKISEVRLITVLICLLFIVFYFVSGAVLSRYFSRRVGKIVSVLDSFQEGNFHKRINFKGNDEFTRISLALNEMGQNIGELIHKVYVAELDKKETELDMLQAQINPHFLYNTLSSINRLAKFGELDKLQLMVMDLAKFYRLSLNEGRIVLPISEELEQANAYINIQKIKYEDRMGVIFDIDPEIMKYDTIKLIIQPFIENILEHAWCADHINIRIVGTRDGETIQFKIIDDGVGISSELLEQMADINESANVGYGIYNVNQRIKLFYGPSYGVHIYSKLGIGTTVCIRFPIVAPKNSKVNELSITRSGGSFRS